MWGKVVGPGMKQSYTTLLVPIKYRINLYIISTFDSHLEIPNTLNRNDIHSSIPIGAYQTHPFLVDVVDVIVKICSIKFRWRLECVYLSHTSLVFFCCTSHLSTQIRCIFLCGLTYKSLNSLTTNFWSFKIMLCNIMHVYMILRRVLTLKAHIGCCIIPQRPWKTQKSLSTYVTTRIFRSYF